MLQDLLLHLLHIPHYQPKQVLLLLRVRGGFPIVQEGFAIALVMPCLEYEERRILSAQFGHPSELDGRGFLGRGRSEGREGELGSGISVLFIGLDCLLRQA